MCYRLYNNPGCPFVERTRLVLAAKNIPFQCANVNLRSKPAYIVEDGGSIPILETGDSKVIGSENIINFVLEKEGGELFPADEESRKQLQEFIDRIDEKTLIGLGWKAAVFGGDEDVQKFAEKFDEIEKELSKNDKGNRYLHNSPEITFADVYLSPPIVRGYFAVQEKLKTVESLDVERYQHIGEYVQSITTHPILGLHVTSKWGYLNY